MSSTPPRDLRRLPELSHAEWDTLLAHPAYFRLRPDIETLMAQVPAMTPEVERTATLTWAYQSGGVLAFVSLAERITGEPDLTRRKRQVRAQLRTMQRLRFISLVNFPGEPDPDGDEVNADVIGSRTLVCLTHLGMVWLERAWAARLLLGGGESVHQSLVLEEEESRGAEPHWCEDLLARIGEPTQARGARVSAAMLTMNSVFHLAAAAHEVTRCTDANTTASLDVA
jgi:hypothetical protein